MTARAGYEAAGPMSSSPGAPAIHNQQIPSYVHMLAVPTAAMRYKMQATKATPNEYAQWINDTGDDTNRPGDAVGPSVRVASWEAL